MYKPLHRVQVINSSSTKHLTDADRLEEVKEVTNKGDGLAELGLSSVNSFQQGLQLGEDALERLVEPRVSLTTRKYVLAKETVAARAFAAARAALEAGVSDNRRLRGRRGHGHRGGDNGSSGKDTSELHV